MTQVDVNELVTEVTALIQQISDTLSTVGDTEIMNLTQQVGGLAAYQLSQGNDIKAEFKLNAAAELVVSVTDNATTIDAITVANDGTMTMPKLVTMAAGIGLGGDVLDDYSAGAEWTPVPSFDGDSTGITTSTASGYSVDIAGITFFTFAIDFTSIGAQTGKFEMRGMPSDVKNALSGTSIEGGGNVTFYSGLTGVHGLALADRADDYIGFYYKAASDGGMSLGLTEAQMTDATVLRGSGWYFNDN